MESLKGLFFLEDFGRSTFQRRPIRLFDYLTEIYQQGEYVVGLKAYPSGIAIS